MTEGGGGHHLPAWPKAFVKILTQDFYDEPTNKQITFSWFNFSWFNGIWSETSKFMTAAVNYLNFSDLFVNFAIYPNFGIFKQIFKDILEALNETRDFFVFHWISNFIFF